MRTMRHVHSSVQLAGRTWQPELVVIAKGLFFLTAVIS